MQNNEETVVNKYKGYPLFNDVEDFTLRNKNRGVIMANICEEHINNDRAKVSPRGVGLVLGYFKEILPVERLATKQSFEDELAARGIRYGS